MIAMRLAKAGYWGGDPQKVLEARCDTVLAAVEYEGFVNDYEREMFLINRSEK